MKKLNENFRRRGINYKIINRTEGAVLFELSTTLRNEKIINGFEVCKIIKVKQKEMFGNIVEAHEAIPSDEQFGMNSKSYAFYTLNKAQVYYNSLNAKLGYQ